MSLDSSVVTTPRSGPIPTPTDLHPLGLIRSTGRVDVCAGATPGRGCSIGIVGLPSEQEVEMSEDAAGRWPHSAGQPTIAEIVEGIRPMGDLSRFAIEDLTPEEEDEFFAILETA